MSFLKLVWISSYFGSLMPTTLSIGLGVSPTGLIQPDFKKIAFLAQPLLEQFTAEHHSVHPPTPTSAVYASVLHKGNSSTSDSSNSDSPDKRGPSPDTSDASPSNQPNQTFIRKGLFLVEPLQDGASRSSTALFGADDTQSATVALITSPIASWSQDVKEQIQIDAAVDVKQALSATVGESVHQAPLALAISSDNTSSDDGTNALSMGDVAQCSSSVSATENDVVSRVYVKDRLVAEFPTVAQAEQFAERIETLLADDSFEPDQLTVASRSISDEESAEESKAREFGIWVENNALVSIDPSLAQFLGQEADWVAIAWTNNLRVALGAKPLSLGEAQASAHQFEKTGEFLQGIASWYGPYFHGRLTASGDRFDQNALTAAHPSLPFDTLLKVTNVTNGRTVVVRINDRGPYIGRRTLDLSRRAAQCLGSETVGVVPYEAEILKAPQDAQPWL